MFVQQAQVGLPPNHTPAISNYPTYDYWSAAASCSVVMLNVPFDVWLLWGKWLESGKGQNWIAADKGLLCKCKYSPECLCNTNYSGDNARDAFSYLQDR